MKNLYANTNKGWKNGHWDLSQPFLPKKTISGLKTDKAVENGNNKNNGNKQYIPLSVRKAGSSVYQNYGFGKTKFSMVLYQGLKVPDKKIIS